jgi:hypothetical protein
MYKFNPYPQKSNRSSAPFLRHLYSMSINGFYARECDADDIAFLEQVREKGTVNCGSLADVVPTAWYDHTARMPLLEELQYWETPWEVEEGVARRLGRPRVEREQNRWAREEADRIRRERWAVIRLQRAMDKATMAAEVAREEREWQQRKDQQDREREARLTRTMEADKEWDAAQPKPRFYRKVSSET